MILIERGLDHNRSGPLLLLYWPCAVVECVNQIRNCVSVAQTAQQIVDGGGGALIVLFADAVCGGVVGEADVSLHLVSRCGDFFVCHFSFLRHLFYCAVGLVVHMRERGGVLRVDRHGSVSVAALGPSAAGGSGSHHCRPRALMLAVVMGSASCVELAGVLPGATLQCLAPLRLPISGALGWRCRGYLTIAVCYVARRIAVIARRLPRHMQLMGRGKLGVGGGFF